MWYKRAQHMQAEKATSELFKRLQQLAAKKWRMQWHNNGPSQFEILLAISSPDLLIATTTVDMKAVTTSMEMRDDGYHHNLKQTCDSTCTHLTEN
ncbi:hypothetical protein Plhal304r1_c006g0024791 [Plasmopara halstedii]